MERTPENLWFCEEQILRLAVIRFWDRLTDRGKEDLRDNLCDSSDSQAQAEARISAWIATQRDLPMPADFTLMALEEKREARAQESWKQPGPPKAIVCQKCHGTGWHFLYKLQTREGHGGSSFTKTDSITKEVFDSFSGGKLDPQKQKVYSEAKPCDCGPSREQVETRAERDERETAGKKWDAEFPDVWEAACKRADAKRKNYKSTLQKIVNTTTHYTPAGDEGDEYREPDAEGDRRKEPMSVVLPFFKKQEIA